MKGPTDSPGSGPSRARARGRPRPGWSGGTNRARCRPAPGAPELRARQPPAAPIRREGMIDVDPYPYLPVNPKTVSIRITGAGYSRRQPLRALRTGRHLRRHSTLRDHWESSARLGQAFLRHLRNGHSLSLGEARHHHAERVDDHAPCAVADTRHAGARDVHRVLYRARAHRDRPVVFLQRTRDPRRRQREQVSARVSRLLDESREAHLVADRNGDSEILDGHKWDVLGAREHAVGLLLAEGVIQEALAMPRHEALAWSDHD